MVMAALAEIVGMDQLSLAGLTMPVTLRLAASLSDEELIAFSRRNRPYRIERNANGELEIMSPVGSQGSHWEALVVAQLYLWANEHGGISFSSNGGFTLSDGSMLSPDAAWVSEARWNALSGVEQRRYAPICPEFLIEILSESDSRSVPEAKMERWIANGAQLAWMIDPYAATVRIYEPGKDVVVLERPDSIEAETVVAGFRLTTWKLWDV
jgi:Uma2 family endonuclease